MTDLQRYSYLACAAFAVLLATAFVSVSSVFSLAAYALVLSLVWKFVLRWSHLMQGLSVFLLYVGLTLSLFVWQLYTNPDYFGFSGGLGVGADDSYFYSLVAPELPPDFPVRDGYWLRSHSYADVLQVLVSGFVLLHLDVHPLDLLFFNALGLTFVPFFAARVAYRATQDERTAMFACIATLICPFLITNSLILIREGWMALCFIGAIYFLMARRYLLLLLALTAAFYLRLEVGILLLLSIVAYIALIDGSDHRNTTAMHYKWRSGPQMVVISLLPVVLVVCGVALIGLETVITAAIGTVYREEFLETFIGVSTADGSGGTFYKINQFPWFVSVPLSFLFFIGSPFFTLTGLVNDGEYIPRMLLANVFGLMFIAYFAFFIRGIARVLGAGNVVMSALILIFLADILILSQASMQIRHKVALMPLFYVIVAYGFVYKKSVPWIAGLASSIGLLFVTVGVNAL